MWRYLIAMVCTVLFSTFPAHIAEAADPKVEKTTDAAEIGSEIQKLGGTVEFDETQPGKPMISVRISGFRATDAMLERLKTVATLQELCLATCGITDTGLRQLSGLKELRVLELHNLKITDDSLKTLSNFSKLEVLSLLGCQQITDDGLTNLEGLNSLRELDLRGTKIGDAGLRHLAGLTKLRSLQLVNTRITNTGLQTVQKFQELRTLSLDGTETSDAGLEYLKTLAKLQRVSLSGKNTTKAVRAFKNTLPKTFVLHIAEAFEFDRQKYNSDKATSQKVESAMHLAEEIATREASGKETIDQKKNALAIIDEFVGGQNDMSVSNGFAVAQIAFLLGANDKAIAVMEKVVRLWPKEQSPGMVVPVDAIGMLHIGTYARYGNDPKRAIAAYMTVLDMARDSPVVYGGIQISCYFRLAEIESHFNHDPAKAIAWLDRIVQWQPPKVTRGESGSDSANGWQLWRNLARHEIALLLDKQPDWRGALDEGSIYMFSMMLLYESGLAMEGSDLQRVARSKVSRLDRAMAQYLLGAGIQGQMFTDSNAQLLYLKDLLASDSFFAPAGGVGLARYQNKEGKTNEAQESLRKLIAQFPSLKAQIDVIGRDLKAGQ